MQTISNTNKNINIHLSLLLLNLIISACATNKGFSIDTNNDATIRTAETTPLYHNSEELKPDADLSDTEKSDTSAEKHLHEHKEEATEDEGQSDDGENQ